MRIFQSSVSKYNYINNMSNKRIALLVIVLYICSVGIRFYFSNFIKRIETYPDELIYWEIASSLANKGEILVHNFPMSYKKILYPIIISPAFLVEDTLLQIKLVSLINSLVMCSSIFPIYKITKKLSNKNIYILISLILTSTLPSLMFTMTFMSEVAFYPLVLWFIYFVLKYIKNNDRNSRITNAILIGCFSYLVYLNKAVGLYCLVSFLFFALSEPLFFKAKFKDTILFIISTILTFLFMHILIDKLLLNNIDDIYLQTLQNQAGNKLDSLYKIFYFIYAYIYNCLISILSYFYFPFVLPLFYWRKMRLIEKKFYLFAVSTFLCAIGVATIMISVESGLGTISVRQNLRYSEVLTVPFLLLFITILQSVFVPCLFNKDYRKNTIVLGTTVTFLLLFITQLNKPKYNFYSRVCYPSMAFYIDKITTNNKLVTDGAGEWIINTNIAIFTIFLSIVILIGTYLFFSKYKKVTVVLCFTSILVINLLNTATLKDKIIPGYSYNVTKETINEIYELNQFSEFKNNNVLVACNPRDGKDRLLDTYLNIDTYDVNSLQLLTLVNSEKGYVNLNEIKLPANYPATEYSDLTKIDYIITDNSINFDQNSVEQIPFKYQSNFKVYKNLHSDRLYCKEVEIFPNKAGDTITIYPIDNIFKTQQKLENNQYISINTSDALIYGPYKPIMAGNYDFKIFYDYGGENEDLGYADIYLSDLGILSEKYYINNSSNVLEIDNFYIAADSKQAELRIYPSVIDLRITKIEIQRIS